MALDWLRVLACFFVIVIHVSAQGFYPFNSEWLVCTAYDSFARFSVPVFFMISGYFLLNGKCVSPREFYGKRFLRILLPFILCSFIYWILYDYSTNEYLNRLFNVNGKKFDGHLWYVYVLIGIYLIAPIFNMLYRNDNGIGYILIYVGVWFVLQICYPTIKTYFRLSYNPVQVFGLHYIVGYLGYFLIGGLFSYFEKNLNSQYIQHYSQTRSNMSIAYLCMFVAGSVAIFSSTIFYSEILNKPSPLFFNYLSIFVWIQSIALFLFIRSIDWEPRPIINKIAIYSYWIYLIHILVLKHIQQVFKLSIVDHAFVMIPMISVVVFLVSWLIAIPLSAVENWICLLIKQR